MKVLLVISRRIGESFSKLKCKNPTQLGLIKFPLKTPQTSQQQTVTSSKSSSSSSVSVLLSPSRGGVTSRGRLMTSRCVSVPGEELLLCRASPLGFLTSSTQTESRLSLLCTSGSRDQDFSSGSVEGSDW